MSCSTLATRMALGEATRRAYLARRQKAVAKQGETLERRVAERRLEFEERGLTGAERLGELAGRCDSIADFVPEEDLRQVRESYERLVEEGHTADASSRVEELEQRADRSLRSRLQREVMLEAAIAANGGELVSEIEWNEDGSLSAIVGFPDQVRMPVTLSGPTAPPLEDSELIEWHTADSNIASLETADGTQSGCAAELGYVRAIVDSCPDMSFDEQSLAEAQSALEEEEEAGWEEMEAG